MQELTRKTIEKIINVEIEDKKLLIESIKNSLKPYFIQKAVLGFDVYRYSKYPIVEQTLIPHIFKLLYEVTINSCLRHEKFIFQKYAKEDFEKQFIDAGDGGFQIFNIPIESLVFAVYFQANIQRFNSGFFKKWEKLKMLIGEITLRYSLTYDSVYNYKNNYYGPAIINNARIIARDKLNRFLIDENTCTWFKKNFNGLESLIVINESDFNKIEVFNSYNFSNVESYLFQSGSDGKSSILNVDLLKIGEVQSKLDIISIYSVFLQSFMTSGGKKFDKLTVSIGNLNSSGIIEK